MFTKIWGFFDTIENLRMKKRRHKEVNIDCEIITYQIPSQSVR